MNGGGKQTLRLRVECVILGTDVVGVLSPISQQVETSEMLFDLPQTLLYTLARREALVHMSQAAPPPERNIFAATPSVVL